MAGISGLAELLHRFMGNPYYARFQNQSNYCSVHTSLNQTWSCNCKNTIYYQLERIPSRLYKQWVYYILCSWHFIVYPTNVYLGTAPYANDKISIQLCADCFQGKAGDLIRSCIDYYNGAIPWQLYLDTILPPPLINIIQDYLPLGTHAPLFCQDCALLYDRGRL